MPSILVSALAVQVPKLNWVFRGFYGHFYQPPPLTSISGPALAYANSNNTSFIAFTASATKSISSACRFPSAAGCSTPTPSRPAPTISSTTATLANPASSSPSPSQGALIQGWEPTLRSPLLWRFGQVHLAYSNQIAQQSGAITGGLICYDPIDPSRLRGRARLFRPRPRSAQYAERRV